MPERLKAHVLAWLHETFPERQVYVRSEGRVQFFTFGPVLQGVIAGLSLLSLGWVAFATVNVIFKDRIISAKERRYQQWQMASENRIADLQISNDELHGALVLAEDKFKAAADELEAKQNGILDFLNRKRQVDAALAGGNVLNESRNPNAANDANDTTAAHSPGAGEDDSAAEDEEPVKPKPAARSRKSSFLDVGGAVGRIAGALFGKHKPDPLSGDAIARHPVLKRLTAQTDRLARIGAGEATLIAGAEKEAGKGVTQLQMLLRRAGIRSDGFEQRIAQAHGGIGGPDIPLGQVQLEGIHDQAFQKAYINAYATLDRLNQLLYGINHVPLMAPARGPQFEVSSGFGPRYESLTRRYAFHPGIDIAGPSGSNIHATAPGIVTWAGARGTYGKMVEIDHGFTLRTRYGHMSKVMVRVGQRVKKGAVIGKLGSTGRSTGPHIHYEVWYDNTVKNPRNFFEAGRYVLKQG